MSQSHGIGSKIGSQDSVEIGGRAPVRSRHDGRCGGDQSRPKALAWHSAVPRPQGQSHTNAGVTRHRAALSPGSQLSGKIQPGCDASAAWTGCSSAGAAVFVRPAAATIRSARPAGALTGGADRAWRKVRASSSSAFASGDEARSSTAAWRCASGQPERSSPSRSIRSSNSLTSIVRSIQRPRRRHKPFESKTKLISIGCGNRPQHDTVTARRFVGSYAQ